MRLRICTIVSVALAAGCSSERIVTVSASPASGPLAHVARSTTAPIFFLDGKEVTEAQVGALDINTIRAIDVQKGTAAVTAFGERARNGVVIITTR